MKRPAVLPLEVHVERGQDHQCRAFLGAVNGKPVPERLRGALVSIPDRFMDDPEVAAVFQQLTSLIVGRLVMDVTGRDNVRTVVIDEDPNPTKQ